MTQRRFPPPWTVEEQPACFVVRDHNGQALAYIYYEDEPGRQSAATLLSKDEARRIVNFANNHPHPRPCPEHNDTAALLDHQPNAVPRRKHESRMFSAVKSCHGGSDLSVRSSFQNVGHLPARKLYWLVKLNRGGSDWRPPKIKSKELDYVFLLGQSSASSSLQSCYASRNAGMIAEEKIAIDFALAKAWSTFRLTARTNFR
jgi:hypothetical protein